MRGGGKNESEWPYLKFTSEGTSTIGLSFTTGDDDEVRDKRFYYSYDAESWNLISFSFKRSTTYVTYTSSTDLTISNHAPVYIRGDNVDEKRTITMWDNIILVNFSSTGDNIRCYGNMMSLYSYSSTIIQVPEYGFQGTFRSCNNLIKAPALPATILGKAAYHGMFSNCTSLQIPPVELCASSLSDSCYQEMFSGCTSLQRTPKITVLSAPFQVCMNMFSGCSALRDASNVKLPSSGYLQTRCFSNMFKNCTSLQTAPELSSTSLGVECYSSMFAGCSSLVKAPELPAVTVGTRCYSSMFTNCTRLAYVKAMFTNEPNYGGIGATDKWLTGVSSSGTFVKNSAATWDVTGESGIPEGWIVETADA